MLIVARRHGGVAASCGAAACAEDIMNVNRRKWLGVAASGGLMGIFHGAWAAANAGGPDEKPRIGVIGAGKVGGTVGALWVKAGYPVMFASRHPDELKEMAASLGKLASTGTPRQAAAYGEILFFAVPYAALPDLGKELVNEIRGKVVLDACNPILSRDGAIAQEALRDGVGVTSAALLPGTRLVRAFNSLGASAVAQQAHRAGTPLAIPIAGNDKEALDIASRLIRDAGLEPVVIGPLASARLTQPGGPAWLAAETAPQLRKRLGLPDGAMR
jgi:predicted dinucleotide-binding enzyme